MKIYILYHIIYFFIIQIKKLQNIIFIFYFVILNIFTFFYLNLREAGVNLRSLVGG
jgi:hypothetical protein